MGFGAGMGLPNIKKNVDRLAIDSLVGKGTRIEMVIDMKNLNQQDDNLSG
jgi:anti-sigma regulatory factor (Ser/Thr protein kinase)